MRSHYAGKKYRTIRQVKTSWFSVLELNISILSSELIDSFSNTVSVSHHFWCLGPPLDLSGATDPLLSQPFWYDGPLPQKYLIHSD
jgi:hypothetical protein